MDSSNFEVVKRKPQISKTRFMRHCVERGQVTVKINAGLATDG